MLVSGPEPEREARLRVATPGTPGAVAILELSGAVDAALASLFDGEVWPVGRCRLRQLADIDVALVARVSPGLAWIMPHGGARIVQRLAQYLVAAGIKPVAQADPMAAYPEAASKVEAHALAAVSRAASPLAVDLLLDQRARWAAHQRDPRESAESIVARSRSLDRLLLPPLVVLVGRPNAGKSTLTNALLGRQGSIASETQGTTRDYVMAQLDLAGLVVRWCDTPGRHDTSDSVEHEAIALSAELISLADCLISACAPGIEWPELPRPADLRIVLKADLEPDASPWPDGTRISARTGVGLAELVQRIRSFLVPAEALMHQGPWRFDNRLDPL